MCLIKFDRRKPNSNNNIRRPYFIIPFNNIHVYSHVGKKRKKNG